jgi:hypothetical protein
MGTTTTTLARSATLRNRYACFIGRERIDGYLWLDGFSAWIYWWNHRSTVTGTPVYYFCATAYSFRHLWNHF